MGAGLHTVRSASVFVFGDCWCQLVVPVEQEFVRSGVTFVEPLPSFPHCVPQGWVMDRSDPAVDIRRAEACRQLDLRQEGALLHGSELSPGFLVPERITLLGSCRASQDGSSC